VIAPARFSEAARLARAAGGALRLGQLISPTGPASFVNRWRQCTAQDTAVHPSMLLHSRRRA
jgi:hypothetical protein